MQAFSKAMLLKRNCRCKPNELQDKNSLGQETQELLTSFDTSHNQMQYYQAIVTANKTPKFRCRLAGERSADKCSGDGIRPWFVHLFISVKRPLIGLLWDNVGKKMVGEDTDGYTVSYFWESTNRNFSSLFEEQFVKSTKWSSSSITSISSWQPYF